MKPTAESIKRANAMETHPSQPRQDWREADLASAFPSSADGDHVNGVLRVTYADPRDASGATPDVDDGDFRILVRAPQARAGSQPYYTQWLQFAESVSRYPDVFAVALYLADEYGGTVAVEETPLIVYSDGTPYALG